MASKRIARLNEQLKREIAGLLRTEVRDPRVGIVTVTGVDTAADLGSAKVYVRMLGDDEERAETMDGLAAAAPYLRTTLGKTMRIRKVPELRFQEDRSLQHARRIEAILDEVLPEDDDEAEGAQPEPEATGDGG